MVQSETKKYQGYGSALHDDEESLFLGQPTEVEEKKAFPSLRVILLSLALSLLGVVAVVYHSGANTASLQTTAQMSLESTLGEDETSVSNSPMSLKDDFIVAYNAGESLESNCDCTAPLTKPLDCQSTTIPGWKGIDLVDLYNNHVMGMTYKEYIPKSGNTAYTTNYGGYSVQFLSEANRVAFEEEPTKYVPQYGGFCSYGIAVEYCNFGFLWDKDCLGPESSTNSWQYIGEKLYFYRSEIAMKNFNFYQAEMMSSANARWAGWYDAGDIVVNSACMLNDVSDSTWDPSNNAYQTVPGGA